MSRINIILAAAPASQENMRPAAISACRPRSRSLCPAWVVRVTNLLCVSAASLPLRANGLSSRTCSRGSIVFRRLRRGWNCRSLHCVALARNVSSVSSRRTMCDAAPRLTNEGGGRPPRQQRSNLLELLEAISKAVLGLVKDPRHVNLSSVSAGTMPDSTPPPWSPRPDELQRRAHLLELSKTSARRRSARRMLSQQDLPGMGVLRVGRRGLCRGRRSRVGVQDSPCLRGLRTRVKVHMVSLFFPLIAASKFVLVRATWYGVEVMVRGWVRETSSGSYNLGHGPHDSGRKLPRLQHHPC
jgi:hypothetical protein